LARLVDLMVIGMTGWITLSWLLVLLAQDSPPLNQLSILATLVTIGLLISAELASGYATVGLREKVSTLAYGGFLVFLVIVLVRVVEILRG